MRLIGIPTETKPLEGRVGLVPDACADLIHAGHTVFIQSGAGRLSGYSDADYERVGVSVVTDAAALYEAAELIIKVKEPYGSDLDHLRAEHTLFCYLHLAADAVLARRLQEIGLKAIAFETVEDRGQLPLLAPMSEIAGRLAVQIGSNLLHLPAGGRGVLLGGVASAERGNVVILGAGNAGGQAAHMAAAMGANVTVFDKIPAKLNTMMALGDNVTALYPYREAVAQALADADLLIGAVLLPGARAPHVVTEDMVRSMQSGSVIVDIAVDQGGCVATTRPTTYQEPTYRVHEVVHFAVTNMPGAVPRSASQSLSASLIPYVMSLASGGLEGDNRLQRGLNVAAGKIVHPVVAEALAS